MLRKSNLKNHLKVIVLVIGGSMSKLLLGVSFLSLSILLFFGINNPGDPIMWLASSSQDMLILRTALMATTFGLLIGGRLIGSSARIMITVITLGLAIYTLHATYMNTMRFEDTLVIMMSCISMLIIGLEPRPRLASKTIIINTERTRTTARRAVTAQ